MMPEENMGAGSQPAPTDNDADKPVAYVTDDMAAFDGAQWRYYVPGARAAVEATVTALRGEVERLTRHVELLQNKINGPEECACAYDSPDDICMHHSPQLAASQAEVARLREALSRMLLEFDYLVDGNILPDIRNDVIFVEARAALEPKP